MERVLREEAGSATAPQRQRNDALERRLEKLEEELHEGLDAVRGEIGQLREDQGRRWESLEHRPASREAQGERRQESPGPADAPSANGPGREKTPETGRPRATARLAERLYPKLVTKESAPDDQEVFGEAWPLIEEWRDIWKSGHLGTGKGLGWLEVEERVRKLEVALLEEHCMTLPLEKQLLHGLFQSAQIDWRKATLHEVRRAVAWRHLLRKVLTLGRWRSSRQRGRA